jgi:serine-type D-Ala-D-Ala carboxypeptidase/endopeptidase (penicillin-binding protein 4)
MIKNRLVLVLFASLCPVSTISWAALPAPIAQSMNAAGVPKNAFSMYVREIGRERPIVEHRATAAMNPASTMKIVTTLVGLDVLTPNYTWKTDFMTTARIRSGVLEGPLTIRGSGDPKFTWEHLQAAVKALREQGIREIAGDVILDRSKFAPVKDDPAQFDGKPLRPYNVVPDALLYNFKSVGFKFAVQPDKTVAITTDGPTPDGLTINNRLTVTSGSCLDWRASIAPAFEVVGNTVEANFTGTYALDCAEREWYVSLFDHSAILAGSFARMWRDSGGVWKGAVKDGRAPTSTGARVLYSHVSAPLATMVADINKFSNNVMARQLLLTVDAEIAKSPGRAGRGGRSIREWAKSRGFDVPELVIENGAGLSRSERISAKSLGAFLEYGLTAPYSKDFVQSLPIAATDGTLTKRFNHRAAEGNAFLKTGTLTGVKSLAGYLRLPDGRLLLFVGIVNHANAESSTQALDSAVEWVYQNVK